MNVLISPSEFAEIATNHSTLYKLAGCPSITVTTNNYGWRQTSDLRIDYPDRTLFDMDGEPNFDDGYDPQEIFPEDVIAQLNVDPAFPGTTIYVGKFFDKSDEQCARFEVQADSKATHILLVISNFDDILLPSQSDFAAFCRAHQAAYQYAPSEQSAAIPRYFCILPITGDMIKLAVWRIWQRQVDNWYTELQHKLYNHKRDKDNNSSTGEIIRDHTIANLERLSNGSFDIGYAFDIDNGRCEICRRGLHGEEITLGEYTFNSPSMIREYLAVIIFLEGVSQPMSNFYAQT